MSVLSSAGFPRDRQTRNPYVLLMEAHRAGFPTVVGGLKLPTFGQVKGLAAVCLKVATTAWQKTPFASAPFEDMSFGQQQSSIARDMGFGCTHKVGTCSVCERRVKDVFSMEKR